jgi:hypothetical protein
MCPAVPITTVRISNLMQYPGRQIKRESEYRYFSFFLRLQAVTIYAFFCRVRALLGYCMRGF